MSHVILTHFLGSLGVFRTLTSFTCSRFKGFCSRLSSDLRSQTSGYENKTTTSTASNTVKIYRKDSMVHTEETCSASSYLKLIQSTQIFFNPKASVRNNYDWRSCLGIRADEWKLKDESERRWRTEKMRLGHPSSPQIFTKVTSGGQHGSVHLFIHFYQFGSTGDHH